MRTREKNSKAQLDDSACGEEEEERTARLRGADVVRAQRERESRPVKPVLRRGETVWSRLQQVVVLFNWEREREDT